MPVFKQHINGLPCVMKCSVDCSQFRKLNSLRMA